MTIDLTTLLAYAAPCVAGIVWGVRLEGKVNEHTSLFGERKQQQDERHEDLKARLERIESKLDTAVGIHTVGLHNG